MSVLSHQQFDFAVISAMFRDEWKPWSCSLLSTGQPFQFDSQVTFTVLCAILKGVPLHQTKGELAVIETLLIHLASIFRNSYLSKCYRELWKGQLLGSINITKTSVTSGYCTLQIQILIITRLFSDYLQLMWRSYQTAVSQ